MPESGRDLQEDRLIAAIKDSANRLARRMDAEFVVTKQCSGSSKRNDAARKSG